MSEKLCALRKIGGGKKVINSGTGTASASTSVKVTLGYRPKYLTVGFYKDSTHSQEFSYWSTKNSTQYRLSGQNGSVVSTLFTNLGGYLDINDDGFTINPQPQGSINAYGTAFIWFATEE